MEILKLKLLEIFRMINEPEKFKKHYSDKIRNLVKKDPSLLHERARIASRRYLAAVCFKVSANSTQYKNE